MKLKKYPEHFKLSSDLVGPLKCLGIFRGIFKRLVKIRYLDIQQLFNSRVESKMLLVRNGSIFYAYFLVQLASMYGRPECHATFQYVWMVEVKYYAHPGKPAWTISNLELRMTLTCFQHGPLPKRRPRTLHAICAKN
jgi:hypothetical protein